VKVTHRAKVLLNAQYGSSQTASYVLQILDLFRPEKVKMGCYAVEEATQCNHTLASSLTFRKPRLIFKAIEDKNHTQGH
jgi:hypothetical protein